MALKSHAKFEGKLTGVLENDMRNLANFHQSTLESLKIETFIGSFYPNQRIYELKIYRELGVMTIKNDAKFEEELTCQFKIDMRNLTNFDRSTRKSKNLHFNGLLLTKVYNV